MKFNKFQEMKALLEMIAPYEHEDSAINYKGGAVSYEWAKDYFEFTKTYVKLLKRGSTKEIEKFEKENYLDDRD